MKFGTWNVGIRSEDFNNKVSIQFWRDRGDGRIEILGPDFLTLKTIGESDIYDGPPTARVSREMLQGLANALYQFGVHPEQRRFDEEVKLLNDHLQDMRKLVFKE